MILRCFWFHSNGCRRGHSLLSVQIEIPAERIGPRHADCPHNERFPFSQRGATAEEPRGRNVEAGQATAGAPNIAADQDAVVNENAPNIEDIVVHNRGGGLTDTLRRLFTLGSRHSSEYWERREQYSSDNDSNLSHPRVRKSRRHRRRHWRFNNEDEFSEYRRRVSPQQHGRRRTRSYSRTRWDIPYQHHHHRSSRHQASNALPSSETQPRRRVHTSHNHRKHRVEYRSSSRALLPSHSQGWVRQSHQLVDLAGGMARAWPIHQRKPPSTSATRRRIIVAPPRTTSETTPRPAVRRGRRSLAAPHRRLTQETGVVQRRTLVERERPDYDELDEEELFMRLLEEERGMDPVLRRLNIEPL